MENILDETIIIIIIEDQQFKFKNFKEYHQKLEYFKTEKIENKIIDIIIKEELIKFDLRGKIMIDCPGMDEEKFDSVFFDGVLNK